MRAKLRRGWPRCRVRGNHACLRRLSCSSRPFDTRDPGCRARRRSARRNTRRTGRDRASAAPQLQLGGDRHQLDDDRAINGRVGPPSRAMSTRTAHQLGQDVRDIRDNSPRVRLGDARPWCRVRVLCQGKPAETRRRAGRLALDRRPGQPHPNRPRSLYREDNSTVRTRSGP